MARKIIDIGQKGNDGTGDSLRDSFRKINDNFLELYSAAGLGDSLTFTGLVDTPSSFVGEDNKIASVSNEGDRLVFKELVGGEGVTFDFDTDPTQIIISSQFSTIQGDDAPQLGGPLNAFSGGQRYPLGNLPDLTDAAEVSDSLVKLSTKFTSNTDAYDPQRLAVNKGYADTKVALGGIETINPATGVVDPNQGIMTGPLVLSRDPIADDDLIWDGKVAATKRYVDNSSYFSKVNLYVSTSGSDSREDISEEQRGRALAYAFASVEAACKRAEEIILEAPIELGPYKKKLTYDEGLQFCTLTDIVTSPLSGAGAVAVPNMGLDTVIINNAGTGYLPGDIISVNGGTYSSQILLEVKTSDPSTGAIILFEVTSVGNYTALPPITGATTTTNSNLGQGATFDFTFKLNSVSVTAGGSGYSLVSVRVLGGGGTGAFAQADVNAGAIASISVTASGSGFTSLPTVQVELPRMKIFTNGLKTDYTQSPGPSRDIREGLYLRGETSGALAKILAHDGLLDGNDELFDVDIVSGAFQNGEIISYGNPIKSVNVTILVETGTYYENFPIKMADNVSIAGDEFRRIMIRPKEGMSTSCYNSVHFCRDTVLDNLTLATQRFGYHYLTDSTQPIYPLINNPGGYQFASQLLTLNRLFLKTEVVGWIDAQINLGLAPFDTDFEYNSQLCRRDVGLLVDAMAFDIKYGGQDRTISAALKYYQSASSLIAITEQKAETIAALNYLKTIIGNVLDNVPPAAKFGIEDQIIDPAIIAETNSKTVVEELVDAVIDIIDDQANFNSPKNNDDMDVFLMNDATRVYQVTIQGNGGFALVLDPRGQILTKSPYAQVGSVFSRSTGSQTFAGSLLIDGFAGNQQFVPLSKSEQDYVMTVGELVRKPQTPFSFFRAGEQYRVNYIRSYDFDPAGSTAVFVLDESTPYTPELFTYNESKCYRDTGLIIDAVLRDLVFGSNYQSTQAGIAYTRAYSSEVTSNQLYETVEGINFARDQVLAQTTDPAAKTTITARFLVVTNILQRGTGAIPVLIYPNTVGAADELANSVSILQSNRTFLQDEVVAWINDQIANATPGSIWDGFTYNSTTCARDVGYIVDSVAFDLIYGGNASTVTTSLSYWYNNVSVFAGQTQQSAAAYTHLKNVAGDVIQNILVTPTTGNTTSQDNTSYTPGATVTEETSLDSLFDIIIAAVEDENTIPQIIEPTFSNSENTDFATLRNTVQAVKATIQQDTIDQINNVISKFELITPGNRSMLSNDFTCINDMGYGLLATNGGITEAVSMFTYYCHTAYYALNGGQIRSVGGSSANGVYALKAEGSDPLEVPDIVALKYNMSQGATVYAPGGAAPYQTSANSLIIYAQVDDYTPFNQSEIEIDHGGQDGIVRYLISSAETGGATPAGVVKLNISTTGAGNTSTSGLVDAVADGTRVTIRSVFSFILEDVAEIISTRPSTALVFIENPNKVYRVLEINTAGLAQGEGRITLRENYDFIDALVFDDGTPGQQPAGYGTPGDIQVGLNNLSVDDALRAVGSQFCWKGTVHTITSYQDSDTTGQAFARIKFFPALVDSLLGYTDQVTIRAGAQAGMSGDITAQISTARFTGHDLLDIGTGSYSDSNYPQVIYGIPANPKDAENEVQEIGKGRVFFVSTDQDGNFRVGDLFRVDQGTGTVTFAASIALSSLDGLGFKRGVSIAEFSTDDTMTDNSTDTVPVEQAVRAYIDRRLGQNHNAGIVDPLNLIPATTGGFMALDGSLVMKADMDMGDHKIVAVSDPINNKDAVNKQWHTIDNLQDGTLTTPSDGDFLTFTGTDTEFVNTTLDGDVTITRAGNTITSSISSNVIVNADVNAGAAIEQSKLDMQAANTFDESDPTNGWNKAAKVQSDLGLAKFSDENFDTADGFVRIKANGIAYAELPQVGARSVIGNVNVIQDEAETVTMSDVVNYGFAIKKSQYGTGISSVGYLKHIASGDNTLDSSYEVVADSSGTVANALVRRDASGNFSGNNINASIYSIDSKTVIDSDETGGAGSNIGVIKIYGYRGNEGILIGDGTTVADKKTYYQNDEHVFTNQSGVSRGTLNLGTITTGAAANAGTVTGAWSLSAGSKFDASLGTLQSVNLTTGSNTTAGTLTGTWTMSAGSKLILSTSGELDARNGTLYSDTLNTGAQGTAGQVVGNWTVAPGSEFVATQIENQQNSATINATSVNTGDRIVLRDTNGDFSAGIINAALNGNAATASKWQNARTITLGGDLSGSVSIDGSADVTLNATVTGDGVALGTDTTGQYAESIVASGSGITITAANPTDGTAYTVTSSATAANTASTIVFRDASGNFSAGTITAALSGNASTATTATNANNIATTASNASSAVHYITFVASANSGNQGARTDDGLSYRPDTGELTALKFNGELSGNASSATTANGLNTNSFYQAGGLGIGTAASSTTGEIRATNNITAYYSSDARLKENVRPIVNALDAIGKIRGVRYDWTDQYIQEHGGEDGYFVRKNDVGVIAQEIEKVLPEVVAENSDGYKAVRYERLVALLIEAVKDQQKIINELRRKVGV